MDTLFEFLFCPLHGVLSAPQAIGVAFLALPFVSGLLARFRHRGRK